MDSLAHSFFAPTLMINTFCLSNARNKGPTVLCGRFFLVPVKTAPTNMDSLSSHCAPFSPMSFK